MHRLLAAALLSSLAMPTAAKVYLSRCKMEECVYYDHACHPEAARGSNDVGATLRKLG